MYYITTDLLRMGLPLSLLCRALWPLSYFVWLMITNLIGASNDRHACAGLPTTWCVTAPLATPSVHCLVMGGVLRLLLLTESKLILLIAVGALAVLPTGLLGSMDR